MHRHRILYNVDNYNREVLFNGAQSFITLFVFFLHGDKSKTNHENSYRKGTVCCRVEQPKQKSPRGFSLFQCKVFIGDAESVEKNILQQRPLRVTSLSAHNMDIGLQTRNCKSTFMLHKSCCNVAF